MLFIYDVSTYLYTITNIMAGAARRQEILKFLDHHITLGQASIIFGLLLTSLLNMYTAPVSVYCGLHYTDIVYFVHGLRLLITGCLTVGIVPLRTT